MSSTVNDTMTSSQTPLIESDVTSVAIRYRAQVLTGNSPWLWAPHVAIGALLLTLMAASFLRFHCKYGHKYRTGSQFLTANGFRTGPKNAWMSDKKGSSTTRLPSMSGSSALGPNVSLSMLTNANGRSTMIGRSAAVIVLRPVGDAMSSVPVSQFPVSRHSADPVMLSASARPDFTVDLFPEAVYTTSPTSAGSSNVSVDTAHMQHVIGSSEPRVLSVTSGRATIETSDKSSRARSTVWYDKAWNNLLKPTVIGQSGQGASSSHTWSALQSNTPALPVLQSSTPAPAVGVATDCSTTDKAKQPSSGLLHQQQPDPFAADFTSGSKSSAGLVSAQQHQAFTAELLNSSLASEWSWSSVPAATVGSSSATSCVRSGLTMKSNAESDPEKVLLLDECEEKLVGL